MFSKAAFILCLLPILLLTSQVPALSARQASRDGRALAFATHKVRRFSPAAARAVERKLLLLAPRHKLLRRFVDRATGLVRRNVAAHCARYLGHRPRLRRYLCRVWVQPRSQLSGVAVLCHTAHHSFWLTRYHHRRHRRHASRRL